MLLIILLQFVTIIISKEYAVQNRVLNRLKEYQVDGLYEEDDYDDYYDDIYYDDNYYDDGYYYDDYDKFLWGNLWKSVKKGYEKLGSG